MYDFGFVFVVFVTSLVALFFTVRGFYGLYDWYQAKIRGSSSKKHTTWLLIGLVDLLLAAWLIVSLCKGLTS